MSSREEKKIFSYSIIAIYTFIPFSGIILHGLLLNAFRKDPLKCLKRLGTALVINLAVSDFLFCVTILLQILRISLRADSEEAPLLLSFFTNIFVNVSSLTIASISVDRFVLIAYPIKHRYWITKKLIAVWMTFIWLVSLSYSLKRLIFGIQKNYEDVLYESLLVVLFSLTAVVYASVYIALKRKLKNRTELNEQNNYKQRDEELRLLKEKNFLKTIILIASITFVSYGPWWMLLHIYPESIFVMRSLDQWLLVTIYYLFLLTNFAVNPLIYIFRFPNYRRTFQILYC